MTRATKGLKVGEEVKFTGFNHYRSIDVKTKKQGRVKLTARQVCLKINI